MLLLLFVLLLLYCCAMLSCYRCYVYLSSLRVRCLCDTFSCLAARLVAYALASLTAVVPRDTPVQSPRPANFAKVMNWDKFLSVQVRVCVGVVVF